MGTLLYPNGQTDWRVWTYGARITRPLLIIAIQSHKKSKLKGESDTTGQVWPCIKVDPHK